MNTSSPLIMVIGPGRSGTSLIMQILRAAGIDCGQNWIPTNKNNPRGYFELKWVMNFNRFLLRTAANDETALYPMPDRQSVEALTGIQLPLAFPPHEFAVKDPRFSLTLPVWHAALRDRPIKIILALREEEAVAESMLRAYDMNLSHARTVIQTYLNRARTYIEELHLPSIEMKYEDWTAGETNLQKLQSLLQLDIPIDLPSLIDTRLTHCHGSTKTIDINQIAIGDPPIPLNELQTDAWKENLHYLGKKSEETVNKLKKIKQASDIHIRREDAQRFHIHAPAEKGGEEWTWVATEPVNAYPFNLYKTYNPQKQWLLILGMDALHHDALWQRPLSEFGPILLVEPDIKACITHLNLRNESSLLKLPQLYLFTGEEAFQQLIDSLNGQLEPYFLVNASVCMIPGQRMLSKSAETQPFIKQFHAAFQQKQREMQKTILSARQHYAAGYTTPPRSVLIAAPDAFSWKHFAAGMAQGCRELGMKVDEFTVPFPLSTLSGYSTLSLMLRFYQSAPDCLMTLSHASDLLFRGLESLPVPRLVWYVDEPEHLLQTPHNPHDYLFYLWPEFQDRLSQRGGHDVGVVPSASTTRSCSYQAEYACEVGFVGSVKNTFPYREQLPPDLIAKIDDLVERKLKNVKTPFSQLMNAVDINQDDLAKLIHVLEPTERRPGMTDDQLLRYYFHVECNRARRIGLLLALADFDLKIYGSEDWLPLLQGTPIENAFQGKGLAPEACYDFYRSANISLSIQPLFPHSSPNIREFDIPMCEGFLLTDIHLHAGDNLSAFFTPGREIALFDTQQSVVKAVRHYLAHPAERKQITEAARRRIEKEHTYKHRLQVMLDWWMDYLQSH